MKIAAIVAEYNPFHNGHAFHISETRSVFGASHIVAIMSGNFVQRGDVACIDKFSRAKMALSCGADLVLELPLPWAMSGAETFARGGVGIANALGCVDILSFGSECGDIDLLKSSASILGHPKFQAALKDSLGNGNSYASALSDAVSVIDPSCSHIFESPNDTLGVEYCRAIANSASTMEPVCVKRLGAAHDSTNTSTSDFPVSASFIRSVISDLVRDCASIDMLRGFVPSDSFNIIESALSAGHAPADLSLLDRAIIMKLKGMSVDELAQLPDVSEGLEHRIAACVASISGHNIGFAHLCDSIKCKRYTHARLRRIVLSALLGLRSGDSDGVPPCIRVIAMNERGKEVLAKAKSSCCSLPIITRYAQVNELSERARRIFTLESFATDLWGLALPSALPSGSDLTAKLIVQHHI